MSTYNHTSDYATGSVVSELTSGLFPMAAKDPNTAKILAAQMSKTTSGSSAYAEVPKQLLGDVLQEVLTNFGSGAFLGFAAHGGLLQGNMSTYNRLDE